MPETDERVEVIARAMEAASPSLGENRAALRAELRVGLAALDVYDRKHRTPTNFDRLQGARPASEGKPVEPSDEEWRSNSEAQRLIDAIKPDAPSDRDLLTAESLHTAADILGGWGDDDSRLGVYGLPIEELTRFIHDSTWSDEETGAAREIEPLSLAIGVSIGVVAARTAINRENR